MNQQRQVIYGMRNDALNGKSNIEFLEPMLAAIAESVASKHSPENADSNKWDLKAIEKDLHAELGVEVTLSELNPDETNIIAIGDVAAEQCVKAIANKFSHLEEDARDKISNYIFLQIIDHSWKNHFLQWMH